jgi:hypothetical protein
VQASPVLNRGKLFHTMAKGEDVSSGA